MLGYRCQVAQVGEVAREGLDLLPVGRTKISMHQQDHGVFLAIGGAGFTVIL
jgi:hypothetical protein